MNKIKVLIVEDEAIVAEDIKYTLNRLNYSVPAIVQTGEDAVKKAAEDSPDLILMDIMLRGKMDGVEAAKQIRARKNIPVIYLTAFADDEILDRAKKTEPFGYMIKPFEEKELHTTIETALYKHQTERELREAKSVAENANELKDKFISLVAHDLKSPFSTILGFMKLIMDDTDPALSDKHQSMFERVYKQGRGLLEMIQELLDIGRLKTGKIRPMPNFIDAHFVAASMTVNFKAQAQQKEINLSCGIPKGTRIYADPDLFSQVIQNLVTNAIKFCKKGDSVTLFTPPGNGSTVAVKDTGTGIAQSRHATLFQYEQHTSTVGTAGEKGTGLGLPLCHDIMAAHGGSLELDSEPGKGSIFYARLPFVHPAILLVDDSKLMRVLLRKILQPYDVEIFEAENGKEALDFLAKSKIHLIITDINMPILNGFQLLENIRMNLSIKDIPVIVLTSDEEKKTREEVFRLGANDFANKPIEVFDFIPRVRRYIG